MESVRTNYPALQATWEEAIDVVKDTEVKARITGVAAKMMEFDFFFGLMLAENTDNLSKAFQSIVMTAADSYHLALLCDKVLSQIRTEECFSLFWGLVKKTQYSNALKDVMEFYQGDFNGPELETQLEAFSSMDIQKNGDSITFHDIHKHFKELEHNQHLLMPQVVKVIKLLLLMPATNAVSERSASAMRRIKTYLRSTMTQCRLNNVMVLHIHKHLTDNLDYIKILNEFTSAKEDRRQRFGLFE